MNLVKGDLSGMFCPYKDPDGRTETLPVIIVGHGNS